MEPILREFPYSFDTERLTIRGPLPGDGVRVRTAVLESQAELKEWMPWAIDIPSEEEYEVRVRQGQLRFLGREDLWMMLLLKNTDIIIGGSGLHRINWSVPRFEIGYWVRTPYGGQGYITEAVAGITEFAFQQLGANRVEIRCDAENVRSAAIPQRLGFIHEATLVNESRHHLTSVLRDTMIFAKTSYTTTA
ncbi:MAG: GNAT family N-acetyltransferase [Anaerolineae bacterium]|nr:GNAT family N-acetyltransferase [Anaerolineae bacterium]